MAQIELQDVDGGFFTGILPERPNDLGAVSL